MALAANVKAPVDQLHLVDNRLYTDPRAFELERERIFERVWNFYCHESEIARPGQYLAKEIAGAPLFVVRNAQGGLRAFYNTCRHRGSMVVDQPCGRAASLRCRYHWWTYSLDGDLLSVPGPEAYEPSGWRREDYGLVPVRVESLYGLVFVCLDPEAPSLAEYVGEAPLPWLRQALGCGEMEVFHQRVLPVAANWKGWAENARDGYHVPCVHPFFNKHSPPLGYELLPNGHAVQRLGMEFAGMDPAYAEQLQAVPLPGVTAGEGFILMLFPDLGITLRSSVVSIDSQTPVDAEHSVMESRVLGLRGDDEATRALRKISWEAWFNNPVALEDHPIFELQQRGLHGKGVRYSFIGRGVEATTGTRGDDNRLRQFWSAWRGYMGVERNSLE
jgi:phenylpropionate dioxygenase-like ring-hydroxylating dioxygenase large terminal subunit